MIYITARARSLVIFPVTLPPRSPGRLCAGLSFCRRADRGCAARTGACGLCSRCSAGRRCVLSWPPLVHCAVGTPGVRDNLRPDQAQNDHRHRHMSAIGGTPIEPPKCGIPCSEEYISHIVSFFPIRRSGSRGQECFDNRRNSLPQIS